MEWGGSKNWMRHGQPVQVNRNTNGRNPERWATPEAQNQTGYQTSNGQLFPRLGSQAKGKLNPNWVEQLMGLDVGQTQLPTEWTDCDYSATELSRKQQQRHG